MASNLDFDLNVQYHTVDGITESKRVRRVSTLWELMFEVITNQKFSTLAEFQKTAKVNGVIFEDYFKDRPEIYEKALAKFKEESQRFTSEKVRCAITAHNALIHAMDTDTVRRLSRYGVGDIVPARYLIEGLIGEEVKYVEILSLRPLREEDNPFSFLYTLYGARLLGEDKKPLEEFKTVTIKKL